MRIVDGYNLIGAAGDLGLALDQPDKEERLLRLLALWRSRRRGREPLLVVFDGGYGRLAAGPRRFSRGGIDVEYAVGESADALILRRVRAAANPRAVEVISSDQAVARETAGRGAKATRSQEFAAALGRALEGAPAAEKPGQPSDAEVEAWLKEFGG